jgi:soluble lytic murein transglycosylase
MAAMAGAAVACTDGPPISQDTRLATLSRALDLRSSDPARAAGLCVEAGSGPVLETFRLRLLIESLEASASSPENWHALLAEELPPSLEDRGRLGLASALVRDGRPQAAVEELDRVSERMRPEADERLIEIGDGPWLEPAARRLAVAAPQRLRRASPDLERRVVPMLSTAERIERGVAWRSAGQPRIAVGELRSIRGRGPDEDRRRLELARSELAAGSPTRALSLLPSASRANAAQLVVRADAFRRRGWQRMPDPRARSAFSECLAAADRALASAEPDSEDRVAALGLALECGTESGALDDAVAAWRELGSAGWNGSNRDWLGRRLGVALAQREGGSAALRNLASGLPLHRRCLSFWAAVAEPVDRARLRRLAETPLADLYGSWARQLLGFAEPSRLTLPAEVVPATPPGSVQWLLDRGARLEAVRQWRWIAEARGATRAEAVAASEVAVSLNRQHEAISWLRAGFSGLGTVEMDREPPNAIRAYLPLKWADVLRAAANESGVEPWLIAGVARQESLFGAHARSPRGALGVLQLRPDTARMHARALGFGNDPDLFNPEINIRIGARELARLIRRFGEVEPALAAYNAGETRARRWWRRWPDRRRFTEAIPIPESYNYVRRVLYLAEAYRLVYDETWRRPP